MVVSPDNLEQLLAGITMAPYIVKATALIGVKRRVGSNMFRHQIATMGILIDYKIADPVLLKASVIHDLFEDAEGLPGVSKEEITNLDADGPAVYNLVMEVTRRKINDVPEEKSTYLLRVMTTGSMRARTLKLVDRISNLTALGYVHEMEFIRRQVEETRQYILPYANQVNPDMFVELSDLVSSREQLLRAIAPESVKS
jgi:GTP pyrophosphokinase